ncbi:endonuclease domain-containing protein [Nonlabens ponticola]|uniref:Endonuclease domain-containing protein n=1 Tax=Nonlabens ponticola TaxID=2496866 RepID=A0A3S9MYJ8_9FLAO|nr:endonuclease domain-containing protein [Nonlabens ponticola]AZQ44325.1 endonuclease domain-containing protein [Nonlabens ponticola]
MKKHPPTHNLKHLKKYRKSLRKNLTPAEAYLWTFLGSKKLDGLKFRRQHSIKNYIVDFYCAQHNLIIELDGEGHDQPEQLEKDQLRDLYLGKNGFTVLRYENQYVFSELPHVLNDIRKHCGILEKEIE